MNLTAIQLLEEALERMKLINGDDSKCCYRNVELCSNHGWIHVTEAFLKTKPREITTQLFSGQCEHYVPIGQPCKDCGRL